MERTLAAEMLNEVKRIFICVSPNSPTNRAVTVPSWNEDSLRRLVQREMGEYRVLVVSNRQSHSHEIVEGELRYIAPTGGVTTAIDPVMQECGGTWVAYGRGDRYAVDGKNSIIVPPDAPDYTLRLVCRTGEERGYYCLLYTSDAADE